MATRKKHPQPIEPIDPDPPKRGGKRKGAGRKPTHGSVMNSGIFIRCSKEQKEALTEFVDELSQARQARGESKVELSTWMRELALKHSGNEDLGFAAQASKFSIV